MFLASASPPPPPRLMAAARVISLDLQADAPDPDKASRLVSSPSPNPSPRSKVIQLETKLILKTFYFDLVFVQSTTIFFTIWITILYTAHDVPIPSLPEHRRSLAFISNPIPRECYDLRNVSPETLNTAHFRRHPASKVVDRQARLRVTRFLDVLAAD